MKRVLLGQNSIKETISFFSSFCAKIICVHCLPQQSTNRRNKPKQESHAVTRRTRDATILKFLVVGSKRHVFWNGVRNENDHSRSSKVVDFDTNRKRIMQLPISYQ